MPLGTTENPEPSASSMSSLAHEAENWLQAGVNTQALVEGTLPIGTVLNAEELAYRLLIALPRSRLANLQRRIAPLLNFDIVGCLPTELALAIFSYLSFESLLICGLINHRWRVLANDQSLWKALCRGRGWAWRPPNHIGTTSDVDIPQQDAAYHESSDEGMGDSDVHGDTDGEPIIKNARPRSGLGKGRHSLHYISLAENGSIQQGSSLATPNYKLLYQTHVKLRNRFFTSSYRLSHLQTRSTPGNGHTNSIYCLQLYTYPETGRQVLFTGSRDKTVREWNLTTGNVERVIADVHSSSVLSICAHGGYLASAGSDGKVGLWNLRDHQIVKVINDHQDTVLCVRFDDTRLVSCSKDRTVRIYSFPDLDFKFALDAHRAAVNAISLHGSFIVSASGDRSIILWDADTGEPLRTFDNHHTRGIASIDFCPPTVLTGSSDKHIRLFDMSTLQGWTTSPECDLPMPVPFLFESSNSSSNPASPSSSTFGPDSSSHSADTHSPSLGTTAPGRVCQICGSDSLDLGPTSLVIPTQSVRCGHKDLVRTVVLGPEFVLSGSYDASIKVWDRKTGALVADLTGGHTGRIFCVGIDSMKIISCGEDQRICIWDFSHGIDTRFLAL